MSLEKDVISGVKERLRVWEFHKICIWWERLNSGKIPLGNHYVQLCASGTSDYVAVIKNKIQGLSLLFFECKSDTGQLQPKQKQFRDKFIGIKNVYYYVIINPNQIDEIISNLGIDRLNELPESIG